MEHIERKTMGENFNGFRYVESEKRIYITDQTFKVTWDNVEKSVAEEAGKMFKEKKNFDTFLLQNHCERSSSS